MENSTQEQGILKRKTHGARSTKEHLERLGAPKLRQTAPRTSVAWGGNQARACGLWQAVGPYWQVRSAVTPVISPRNHPLSCHRCFLCILFWHVLTIKRSQEKNDMQKQFRSFPHRTRHDVSKFRCVFSPHFARTVWDRGFKKLKKWLQKTPDLGRQDWSLALENSGRWEPESITKNGHPLHPFVNLCCKFIQIPFASIDSIGRLEYMKVWKGLYFAMWMADKRPVQQDILWFIDKCISCLSASWRLDGDPNQDLEKNWYMFVSHFFSVHFISHSFGSRSLHIWPRSFLWILHFSSMTFHKEGVKDNPDTRNMFL